VAMVKLTNLNIIFILKNMASQPDYPPKPSNDEDDLTDEEKLKNKSDTSVLESESVLSGETEARAKSETATSREVIPVDPKEFAVSMLNDLVAEKKDIETKLSGETTPEERKELEHQKKEKSLEIIKQECEVLGRDFDKDEKPKLEAKKQSEWERSIIAKFGSQEKYKAWEQSHIANNPEALNKRYNDIISGSELLTTKQIERLTKDKEITGAGLINIEFNKEDVAVCLAAGIDITKARFNNFGFSKKITLGDKEFGNINELKDFLVEKKGEYIAKEAEKRSEQRRVLTVDKFEQTILDGEINELGKSLNERQKLKDISDLRNNWAKAKRIFDMLKVGKGKIKTEDGEFLEVGKNDKEIEKLQDKYSTKAVKKASKITGVDLIQEVKKETGYDPDAHLEGSKEQKAFQELLTKVVKEIYQGAKNEIEESTGKKVMLKRKDSVPDIKPEAPVKSENPKTSEKSESPEKNEEEKMARLKEYGLLIKKLRAIPDKSSMEGREEFNKANNMAIAEAEKDAKNEDNNGSEKPKPEEKGELGDIQKVLNFEELYKVLRDKKNIMGSRGHEYTAEKLISMIDTVRRQVPERRRAYLGAITNSEKVQDKVKELLESDPSAILESEPEPVEENEKSPEDKINSAQNLEEFYEILLGLKEIAGSRDKIYDSKGIVDGMRSSMEIILEKVRNNSPDEDIEFYIKSSLRTVTSSMGLCGKFEKLLRGEVEMQKEIKNYFEGGQQIPEIAEKAKEGNFFEKIKTDSFIPLSAYDMIQGQIETWREISNANSQDDSAKEKLARFEKIADFMKRNQPKK
jgi:hypothetical protein